VLRGSDCRARSAASPFWLLLSVCRPQSRSAPRQTRIMGRFRLSLPNRGGGMRPIDAPLQTQPAGTRRVGGEPSRLRPPRRSPLGPWGGSRQQWLHSSLFPRSGIIWNSTILSPRLGEAMHQMEEVAFPRLTDAELARVKGLAMPCAYADGETIFRA